jgi:2-dehydropantoate 2-reductase
MRYSYSIVGTGAVGGLYGARLRQAGATVRFLLRSDYHHVRTHGLRVESSEGDFSLAHVEAFSSAREMPRGDVAVVALKATANHLLDGILPHVLSDEGIVLLLQNGLGEEDSIIRIPGVKQIVAGLCFVCTTKVGPGHIRHLDYGQIRLAQYDPEGNACGITQTMRRLEEDLTSAGIAVSMEEDLIAARWKKLMWNIPFSGLCVARGVTTEQVVKDPHLRQRARAIMDELLRATEAIGHPVESSFADQMIANTEKMRPYAPSMKLDHDAGRPMELETLFAKPLAVAGTAGVAMPLVRELYEELMRL